MSNRLTIIFALLSVIFFGLALYTLATARPKAPSADSFAPLTLVLETTNSSHF